MESLVALASNKSLRAKPFRLGAAKDKSGESMCTTDLSRFAYRHNNESLLITIQILGLERGSWPVGRSFPRFCAF